MKGIWELSVLSLQLFCQSKIIPLQNVLKGKKKKPTLLIIDKIKTDLKSENKQKKISTKFIKKENKNCLHSLWVEAEKHSGQSVGNSRGKQLAFYQSSLQRFHLLNTPILQELTAAPLLVPNVTLLTWEAQTQIEHIISHSPLTKYVPHTDILTQAWNPTSSGTPLWTSGMKSTLHF